MNRVTHHETIKYKCGKCGKCWCTGCLLSKQDNDKFDVINNKFYCSKHRYDKVEISYIPNIYKE